ncbi:MAG: hypothetical protein V2B18_22075 [Pseudomonadota bacterium]
MPHLTENETKTEMNQPTEPLPADVPEDEDGVHVTFLDRSIAFVIFVGPWAYLTDKAQELLLELVSSQTVVNMTILVGLVGFLVLVGWASKHVYRIRVERLKWWVPEEASAELPGDVGSAPSSGQMPVGELDKRL